MKNLPLFKGLRGFFLYKVSNWASEEMYLERKQIVEDNFSRRTVD